MNTNSKILVAVATTSVSKSNAIKKAFEEVMGKQVEVTKVKTDSMVPQQPKNKEILVGAQNRLNQILHRQNKFDYLVSCEGGLMNIYNNWFNIHYVIVKDVKNNFRSIGLSPAYPIPQKYVKKILNTCLADVLDNIFGGKGGVRVLTNEVVTREDLIQQGVIMALTGIINKW